MHSSHNTLHSFSTRPHSRRLILPFLLFLFSLAPISIVAKSAQTEETAVRMWKLQDGSEFKAQFSIELAGTAYFHYEDNRSWMIPIPYLIPEQQEWVKLHSNYGKEPIKWRESKSRMAKAVKGRSKILDKNGELVDFEFGDRMEPEFYVFYTGASWCGPCRRFVRYLKVWYDEFVRHEIPNVELFFVSSDNSASAYKEYINSHDMRWPAIKWSRNYPRTIQQLRRNSIPGMVITDRQGNILRDAHNGKEYRGAQTVLDELKEIVFRTNPTNPLTLQSYFDKILKNYIEKNRGKDTSPTPVYTFVDQETQKQWGKVEAVLILQIHPNGRVIVAEVLDNTRPELEDSIRQTAGNWRLLPALEKGRPVQSTVRLPLKVNTE